MPYPLSLLLNFSTILTETRLSLAHFGASYLRKFAGSELFIICLKRFSLRPWYPRVIRIRGIFRNIAFVEYLFELLRDRVKCREFDKPQLTFSHLCRMRYILQPWLLTRLLICPAETFYGKCTGKSVQRCRSVWSNVLIFRCYKSKYQKIDRT